VVLKSVALTPLGGGVETAKNRPQADEEQPVVAGKCEIAQHDDDDANDEQYEHQYRHPWLTNFFRLRNWWRVPRTRGRPAPS